MLSHFLSLSFMSFMSVIYFPFFMKWYHKSCIATAVLSNVLDCVRFIISSLLINLSQSKVFGLITVTQIKTGLKHSTHFLYFLIYCFIHRYFKLGQSNTESICCTSVVTLHCSCEFSALKHLLYGQEHRFRNPTYSKSRCFQQMGCLMETWKRSIYSAVQ